MKTEMEKRLNQILPRLTSPELLTNTGLGNEIGFYIFDYPPENELEVREHITHLLKQLEKKHSDIKVKHVNLFELVIDYLRSRNLLDKALKIEREKGDAELLKALQSPLHVEKLATGLVMHTQSRDLASSARAVRIPLSAVMGCSTTSSHHGKGSARRILSRQI